MGGIAPFNPDRLPTPDQDAALDAANAPSAVNPFATMADVVGTADSVKVSGADTTAGYLSAKLTAVPSSFTWVIVNPGADEDLRLTAANATTAVPGVIELATQAEVNLGVDAVRAVTPATLAAASTVIKAGQAAGGHLSGTYPSPTVATVPFAVVATSLAAASASIDVNAQKIVDLLDPTAAQDAATKAYVDALVTAGLSVKAAVRVISTSNIVLSAPQTIDGVGVIAGDRVLVAGQTTGADNGVYVVAAGAWSRATDADSSAEVVAGIFVFVTEGTTYADSGHVLTTNNPITLGVTSLTFVQFSGAGQITAGSGLTKTGNTIDAAANADGSIVVNANDIQVGVLATNAQHGNRGGGALHAAATDTTQGFVELATQAETDTGTDTTRAITPSDFANSSRMGGAIDWGSGSVAATTTTRYLSRGFDPGTAPTARVPWIVNHAGTIDMLTAFHDTAGGNANAIVYTVRKNGAAQTLTVSIAANSTTPVSDAANSFTVVSGDVVDIEVTKAAGVGTSPGNPSATFRYRPS